MKKISLLLITIVTVITLAACGPDASVCGEGTVLEGSECVVVENTSTMCSADTGLHTVPSMDSISSWLNWRFIGGYLVSDPDNAWIQAYGAAIFNVTSVPQDPWQGSFTTSGMFLEAGCEYTFEFKLRTEAPNVKPNAIVFGETTDGVSFFEETVDLEQQSTVYSFTVVPESSNYVSTGVYFANSMGLIIIEDVQIIRGEITQ